MRWPVRVQLLLPVLSVVLFTLASAGSTNAYLGGRRARAEQEERLRRVVATLAEASFPLTQTVLTQMTGLSGAEFVLFDQQHRFLQSTLQITGKELEALASLRDVPAFGTRGSKPVMLFGQRSYLVGQVSIFARAQPASPGTLYVLYPEDRWSAAVYEAVCPALVTGAIAAILAVIITAALARRFVRPIHHLVAQTADIAQGHFASVHVSRRNDELRDLALSINRMAAKLAQYEVDVRRNERLRTLGELGAALAHQLRNAATGARMAVELHRQDCARAGGDESLDVALRQLRLMESYVQRFLLLSAPDTIAWEETQIVPLVEDVLTLVRPACSHLGIDLVFDKPSDDLRIRGDPEGLRQLFTNLVANAIDAASQGAKVPARVLVAARRSMHGLGVVSVVDTGPGPPESIANRLFDAFVSGKPGGIGLGLFLAKQIAESHHGSLCWARSDGTTCFSFEFPLCVDEDHGALADRGR